MNFLPAVYLQTNLILLFTSLVGSALVYPVLINFLYKYQFREKVREFGPETHKKKIGTPTMGGIGFFVTTLVVNLLLNDWDPIIRFILIVFSISAFFGLLEDWFKSYGSSGLRKSIRIEVYEVFSKSRKTWWLYKVLLTPWNLFREFTRLIGSNPSNRGVKLKSHYKFLMHLALGAVVSYWLYTYLGRDSILIPFVGELYLGLMYPFFITLFFVFTLNAVAITDGLDGLLTGISLIILPVYWILSFYLGFPSISNFIAVLFGSLLVYLYFNVFPARVFMGDVGSYAIAAALFLIPVIMNLEFVLLITHALCLFDGGVSGIAQQFSVKYTGKRIFKMAPIHHHFEEIGWSESKVTLRFWIFQILLSLLGLLVFFYLPL